MANKVDSILFVGKSNTLSFEWVSARMNDRRNEWMNILFINTDTHTHPINGPLSGTTQVIRYQKGKTNLDFTEARDSEWQWHQLGHMQVCISLQTR